MKEYLGVSRDTLRSWDAAATPKARRHTVTGFRLYIEDALDAILVGASDPEATDGTPRKRRKRQEG